MVLNICDSRLELFDGRAIASAHQAMLVEDHVYEAQEINTNMNLPEVYMANFVSLLSLIRVDGIDGPVLTQDESP